MKLPEVASGMSLPFEPMTLAFRDICYFVKCPRVRHLHCPSSFQLTGTEQVYTLFCMLLATLYCMLLARPDTMQAANANLTHVWCCARQEMSGKGHAQVVQKGKRRMLQLLHDVSGVFRPRILTCLMVSTTFQLHALFLLLIGLGCLDACTLMAGCSLSYHAFP